MGPSRYPLPLLIQVHSMDPCKHFRPYLLVQVHRRDPYKHFTLFKCSITGRLQLLLIGLFSLSYDRITCIVMKRSLSLIPVVGAVMLAAGCGKRAPVPGDPEIAASVAR